MLLYVDGLVLLAASSSDLKTGLEELERVRRKWGMAVNYPKTEAVGVWPARRRRRHDPGWIQQFICVGTEQHCAG